MLSNLRLARLAGLLYFVVLVAGLVGEMYGRTSIFVASDAAATARNLASHTATFRISFASNLVYLTAWILVALTLYGLLRHVNRSAALAMVVLTAISVAILCVNMLNYAAALLISNHSAYANSLGAHGADGLILLFLDLYGIGYFIGQIFFSLWLVPLGYLMFKSGWFPKVLGVLVAAVCITDLAEPVVSFLLPGLGSDVTSLLIVPGGIAEITLIFWLLLKGVNAAGRNAGRDAATFVKAAA